MSAHIDVRLAKARRSKHVALCAAVRDLKIGLREANAELEFLGHHMKPFSKAIMTTRAKQAHRRSQRVLDSIDEANHG